MAEDAWTPEKLAQDWSIHLSKILGLDDEPEFPDHCFRADTGDKRTSTCSWVDWAANKLQELAQMKADHSCACQARQTCLKLSQELYMAKHQAEELREEVLKLRDELHSLRKSHESLKN